MKKVILAGAIAGIAMLFVGAIVSFGLNYLFPFIKAEYADPSLFRPWSDPKMQLFVFSPFMTGLILSWFYSRYGQIAQTRSTVLKGLYLGLSYWLITIPGIFMEYTTFPVSFVISASWSLSVLLQGLCAGLIIAGISDQKNEAPINN